MSAYDNFLQSAGQKDRVTCCAQVTQLLTLDWDVQNDDNLLVVMQLDIIRFLLHRNTFFFSKSPLRIGSPNASPEVVHRPRSLPPLP